MPEESKLQIYFTVVLARFLDISIRLPLEQNGHAFKRSNYRARVRLDWSFEDLIPAKAMFAQDKATDPSPWTRTRSLKVLSHGAIGWYMPLLGKAGGQCAADLSTATGQKACPVPFWKFTIPTLQRGVTRPVRFVT